MEHKENPNDVAVLYREKGYNDRGNSANAMHKIYCRRFNVDFSIDNNFLQG